MSRNIRRLALVMCLVLAASLASCSSGTQNDSASQTLSGKPETDTVRLALTPAGNAFNAIAEREGYLEDEGIKVEYVTIDNDADVLDGLTNGRVDVASNQGTNLPLQRISEGQDLTIFAGYMLTGCMPVFSKVDTKWTGIEDLIGKTMACEPNLYALTGPLLDMGYDPLNDIKWMPCDTQEERIQAVKELLSDARTESLSEIAAKTGLGSARNLCLLFNKTCGVSVREYIRISKELTAYHEPPWSERFE